jgi:hypothetical protein
MPVGGGGLELVDVLQGGSRIRSSKEKGGAASSSRATTGYGAGTGRKREGRRRRNWEPGAADWEAPVAAAATRPGAHGHKHHFAERRRGTGSVAAGEGANAPRGSGRRGRRLLDRGREWG